MRGMCHLILYLIASGSEFRLLREGGEREGGEREGGEREGGGRREGGRKGGWKE